MDKIVTIGIQARSTSTRFPNKVHEYIGNKTILKRIIDSANESAKYLNRHTWRNKYIVNVVVCCPTDDIIRKKYAGQVDILEGSEHDVLGRYAQLARIYKSDFMVRITADCPLIPSFVISSLITKAIHNNYDYISNVEPICRTTPDGWDCEVISKVLLEHADKSATKEYDREHVTTFMRDNRGNFKHGVVVNHIDLSHIKFSVDTKEEYERVCKEYESIQHKLEIASDVFGVGNTHRL